MTHSEECARAAERCADARAWARRHAEEMQRFRAQRRAERERDRIYERRSLPIASD